VRPLIDLLDVATAAAESAADYLRHVDRPRPSEWTEKGRNDFVSEADRHAEALIADALTRGAPGSRVVGEELNPEAPRGGGVVWIVDPLDGTTNFLHGYPQFAVSVGAMVDGALSLGVVVDVTRRATYRAATGRGAYQDGRRLTVSQVTEPRHALLGTGFPFKHPDRLEAYLGQFSRLMRATSGIRRAGAAALDLADLAAGRFDGFWELELAAWDVAAGAVLVREAGGKVTRMDGDSNVLGSGSIVAGNPMMHGWLLDQLHVA
jgi:myo-inositol-1(or 4)-monophosphatase